MKTVELPDAVQGSTLPTVPLTWYEEDGTARDLTDATLTGVVETASGTRVTVASNEISVTDASAGEFTWAPSASAVTSAGRHRVQFTATYSGGTARTFVAWWAVREAL